MTEERKEFKWLKAEAPVPEIYTNYVQASWSLFDVRVNLGQLVPAVVGEGKDFVVQEKASVTFAWPQAKVLRDMLAALVENYERVNGEIKPIKLAPVPEGPCSSSFPR